MLKIWMMTWMMIIGMTKMLFLLYLCYCQQKIEVERFSHEKKIKNYGDTFVLLTNRSSVGCQTRKVLEVKRLILSYSEDGPGAVCSISGGS